MQFQVSQDKIRENFEALAENQHKERKINVLEISFIIFSILIMIPYELASSYISMLILGSINLAADITFVVLLYRLFIWGRQGRLTAFTAVTDTMAALPGLAAITVLIFTLFKFHDFHLGEFLAAGGLGISALKTTRLLRILRLARLFRLIRSIKIIRFLSLRSDSNSAENTVAWLGFIVLVLMLAANTVFTLFGPLAIQENIYHDKIIGLKQDLQDNPVMSLKNIYELANHRGLSDNLVFAETPEGRQPFNRWLAYPTEEAMKNIRNKFCLQNSTRIISKDIKILLDDKDVFIANRDNNLLWTLSIIFAVLIFAILATTIIGRNFTDYLNDYRKAILDSYNGIQSLFKIHEKELTTNDRDSYAFAMGLFVQDFVQMLKGIQKYEKELESKDSEIQDLNDAIKSLETDMQALSDFAAEKERQASGGGGGSADSPSSGPFSQEPMAETPADAPFEAPFEAQLEAPVDISAEASTEGQADLEPGTSVDQDLSGLDSDLMNDLGLEAANIAEKDEEPLPFGSGLPVEPTALEAPVMAELSPEGEMITENQDFDNGISMDKQMESPSDSEIKADDFSQEMKSADFEKELDDITGKNEEQPSTLEPDAAEMPSVADISPDPGMTMNEESETVPEWSIQGSAMNPEPANQADVIEKTKEISGENNLSTADQVYQDLQFAVEIIKKLCEKNPEIMEIIRKNAKFNTIVI